MSHLNPGLISAYNSLTDKHLAGYFSNSRIRRHLQRVGLITRSGRIVPDKEYRTKLMQRVHQRHVRECLAQAIFHKVLDMERVHQIEIKRRLEEFARRERVHKIKVERSKRYEEELIQILSPRPPTGPRAVRTQHSVPEGEPSESSESPGSSRPNTAPGTMQRPARLQPITSSSTAASLRRRTPRRHRGSADWQPPLDNITDSRDPQRRGTTSEFCRDVSPYCLPVINNFVTPVPPTTKRRDRGSRVTSNGTVRGRRLRSINAPSGAELNEEPLALRSSVQQSRVGVNMVYFGKTVHLSRDLGDMRDEVKVFQQHCGGENLCVFKGRLQEGEAFHFVSRRHRGFPFSLTFFLNGLQVERISSCCEFKHRKGTRLAGRHKHFGFTGVEGASPCYKCIIAMGLDKKPTPPPKRAANETETERTSSPSDTHKETAEEEEEEEKETEEVGEKERAASTVDPETPQPQDMETDDKEETVHEDKPREDYEEDFEADDEAEESSKAKEPEAPSPSSDKEEKEKKQASDSEHDAGDEARTSRSPSSSSGSERPSEDEVDEEDHRRAGGSEDPPASEDPPGPPREEPPATQDTPDPEMPAPASPPAPAATQDAQSRGGPGGATGESETGAPPRTEGKGHEGTPDPAPPPGEAGEGEGVSEETGRAKSVQEKLAEAILMEGQCHSEPELSDTTTEDDESPGKDNQQSHEDAPIECETSETQPPTRPEETKGEASAVGEELTVVEQKDAKEELAAPPIDEACEEKSEKDKAKEETPASEAGCTEETTEVEKEDSKEKEDKEASPPQEPEEKEEAEDQEATPQAEGPVKPVEADAAEEVEEAVKEVEEAVEEAAEEVEEAVEEAVKEEEEAVEEAAEEVEEAVKEAVKEEEAVEEVKEAVEEVKEEVKEAVEEEKETVEEVKEAVEEVKEAVEEVKEEVEEAVEEAVKEVEEAVKKVDEAVKEVEEAAEEVDEAVKEVEEAVKEVEKAVEEEVEAGMEVDSRTEPEAKSTEANEESPASAPEGKEDIETALHCGVDEQQTAADSQTADSSTGPLGEPTDVGEAPVSDSGKPGADEATVELAGAQGPGEGSSSSSEPSGAAAVLQQTGAAETRGTKIDHREPVEDLHEESASHEDAGKKSGGEMESFRGRRGDDTEGEGGSVTSGPQSNVEKDKTEKEGGGEDDNTGKSNADQVEVTEEGNAKAKELTGDTTEREEEQEGRKAEEVSEQTAGATGEPAEHTERNANVEAKDPLEGTDDKVSDAADEENAQKEEKPEKDNKETEDGECTQHKVDEEGSEKQVTDIESSLDAKESPQSTEDQAEQNADQVEESEARKQATEMAEEQAKTTVDQDPVKEAKETLDESHVETENAGKAHEADKAKGIQEDKAEETKGNVLGLDGDQGEHEAYKGKVEDENGDTRQRSSEIKENTEDQGDEGSQGENADPKDSEEKKEEKEKGRSKDHEDKDHEGKDHEGKDHEDKDHEDKDHEDKDHEGKDHEGKDHEGEDNKHEKGNVDQGPSLDQVPTEANMKEEQAEPVSDVVEAVKSQEAKQLPDKKDENQDKLSEMKTTKESDQNHGVIVDSPEGQTQSSEPIVVDKADNVDDEKVEAIPESALHTDDKHPDSDHDSAVAVEPTAVNGEHSADTEEGSKPSEEAESVVFKPEAEQAQPPVHQAAQSSELVKDTPGLLEVNETNEKESLISDVLESEDNRDDLVTDWVTLHQTSNYFEKFVEPLDDMKELPSGRSGTDENGLGIMRSESPPQNMTRSQRSEENVEKNEKEREPLLEKSNNSDDNTKLQIDVKSNHSEGQEVTEPAKDKQESKELTEVTPAIPTSEADQSIEESARSPVKGESTLDNRSSSAGDRDQDAPTKGTSENGHSSRTETEDIGENNNVETTVTQCTAEPATEIQQEEGAVREEPEVEEKQTTVEEINGQPSPDKTDGCHEAPEGPAASSRPSPPPPEAQHDHTKETTESREADATPVTDLLAVSDLTSSSASDNGNGEGAQNTPEVQSRPPDRSGGLNEGGKEVQLIEDFKPSVSKDQLSAYRVEETSLFGRTSYPQFTTQTGSGY